MEKYLITARCNPYHARFHFNEHNHKALKYDGTTPVYWVHDNNFGYGYSLEEALDVLDCYAAEIESLTYYDDVTIQGLLEGIREDTDDDSITIEWYSGEGYYDGEVLVRRHSDMCFSHDVMDFYIELMEEVGNE